MRASEFSAHHMFGRSTNGQRLDIRYDPVRMDQLDRLLAQRSRSP